MGNEIHDFQLVVLLFCNFPNPVQMEMPLYVYSLSRKDHEKAEFEVHEVYAIDVLISTGEGKVSLFYISPVSGYSKET